MWDFSAVVDHMGSGQHVERMRFLAGLHGRLCDQLFDKGGVGSRLSSIESTIECQRGSDGCGGCSPLNGWTSSYERRVYPSRDTSGDEMEKLSGRIEMQGAQAGNSKVK